MAVHFTERKASCVYIELSPKKVLKALLFAAALFIVLGVARVIWHHFMGPELFDVVLSRLDPNQETSIPTWFSIILLLASALLLAVIATDKRRRHDRFRYHWAGLALIFALMSIDECASLHELSSYPLRTWFGLGGPLYYAWVLAGAAFVLVLATCYWRFLAHLAPRFRNLFALAAGVYLAGTLGFEMVGAVAYTSMDFVETTTAYMLVTVAEEGCEMIGISLFIYTLLHYLQGQVNRVCVALTVSERASMPAVG